MTRLLNNDRVFYDFYVGIQYLLTMTEKIQFIVFIIIIF